MSQPENNGALEEGIRLFNRGKFFEAHEVWEQVWKLAKGNERTFYQGLIQAAAALVHIQRGNYAGAVYVYLKARRNLERLPELWMGIELGQFRSSLEAYFEEIQTVARSDGNERRVGTVEIAAADQRPWPAIRWACA
jgi:predicted metal-dependent hydrolase